MQQPLVHWLKAFPIAALAVLATDHALAAAGGADPAARAVEQSASAQVSQPEPGSALSKAELVGMVDRIAERYGVELALAQAIVAAESAYDPDAVSRAGAIGLMQVMPATAADYGVRDAQELFDPETNLETGMRHLRRLLSKYRNDYGRVIMAYNAGEGVVDRTNSRVTYRETLNYTLAVIHHYRRNGGTQPTEEALRRVAVLRRASGHGGAHRLMRRYLDASVFSLGVKPTLTLKQLDPGLHRVGPESLPMFDLGSGNRP